MGPPPSSTLTVSDWWDRATTVAVMMTDEATALKLATASLTNIAEVSPKNTIHGREGGVFLLDPTNLPFFLRPTPGKLVPLLPPAAFNA